MINAQRLDEIFRGCLYHDGEDTNGHIVVEGVLNRFGLHPERLQACREEVREMLMDLPDEFRESSGGGHSFLNAYMTRSGEHWGEHSNIEQLMVLGIGLGLAEMKMPRAMWNILPGGMPYFSVRDQ